MVDFAKRMELAITNTYFVKKPAHRVTYNSGGRSSPVDYIMVRRRIKGVVDTKVIVNESVAKQHRIVVSAIIIWTKGCRRKNHHMMITGAKEPIKPSRNDRLVRKLTPRVRLFPLYFIILVTTQLDIFRQ